MGARVESCREPSHPSIHPPHPNHLHKHLEISPTMKSVSQSVSFTNQTYVKTVPAMTRLIRPSHAVAHPAHSLVPSSDFTVERPPLPSAVWAGWSAAVQPLERGPRRALRGRHRGHRAAACRAASCLASCHGRPSFAASWPGEAWPASCPPSCPSSPAASPGDQPHPSPQLLQASHRAWACGASWPPSQDRPHREQDLPNLQRVRPWGRRALLVQQPRRDPDRLPLPRPPSSPRAVAPRL
mmetsp:Transcript_43671/g.123718  ORF Transcript_43671/g.123718 Transcript_43671/m.123718 type:complete len:240 (-) Transcript_43671:353-1072(-)